ncbi:MULTISPECIES: hypothetical protein [Brevibacterium]|jgi:hypothetical protein|uniref:Transcriptional regulator, AbiEi antitoxin, Type IV TA system n=1 Tax=Brevibacterium salitolerans TaxID=1403566 RepID=A0ABN2WFX5_9MICO|nr:hypothetical protein [Brevibacterium sp.]
MDLLHRTGAPLARTGLLALERDGLLDRLAEDVWVPAGTVQDPRLRASALPEPPRPELAASHRTAAWIWWGSGSGRAPAVSEFTTLTRRRVRAARRSSTIYERDVPPPERLRIDGLWVTSPERTLFDLLRLCRESAEPLSLARERCARVPAGDRLRFVRWLDGMRRRPHVAHVRALALAAFAESAQPLTR